MACKNGSPAKGVSTPIKSPLSVIVCAAYAVIDSGFGLTAMAFSNPMSTTVRLINVSDPPQCPLPAVLGPAKQSACFSVCNERLEVDSVAALRYFVDPPPVLNVNLRDGLEGFLKLPFEDRVFKGARRLDNVFVLCLDSKNSEELLKAEVVTWRGIMTK
jgi:hypothetical protein